MRMLIFSLAVVAPTCSARAEDNEGIEFFERRIRPVLVEHCYECHSADSKDLQGGLRLDTRDALLQGGESGPAIEPRRVDQSLLIRAIRYEDLKMPPSGRLPKQAIQDFEEWVRMGAPDPRTGEIGQHTPDRVIDIEKGKQYWAFRPLTDPQPVEIRRNPPLRNPIDQFVLAKLLDAGLELSPAADPHTLARRAYFGLAGLPPAPNDLQEFVNDRSDTAWDALIDRLLESERYGERWARHWLDIARFAESNGFERDEDRPHAWPYRDFVIRAFNGDMRYDQFVRWQIAGDLLAPGDIQALTATGFIVAGVKNLLPTKKEFARDRYDELDDMASTVTTALLGLTVGCARCHDHKYDPIPQRDYYEFISTFRQTVPRNAQVEGLAGGPAAWVARETTEDVLRAFEGGNRMSISTNVHFLVRGNPNAPRELVEPGFLQVLMRGRESLNWRLNNPDNNRVMAPRRVALARWITDVESGAGNLLARVIVNRLWQHHMGRGLVRSPSDFGVRGGRPSHPKLLDWLARQLVQHEWRLKPIHKLIMTSATYRQSYRQDDRSRSVDPENRLLWRRTMRRLEAEAIRDALLAVSGQLDVTMYGPGTLDENSKRRSVYLTVKRTKLIPTLQLFDAPDALQGEGERQSTTVAPQALMLLNDPRVRRYAEGFARRVLSSGPNTLESVVARGFRIALSREPTPSEVAKIKTLITRQADRGQGVTDFCHLLMCANEFLYVE